MSKNLELIHAISCQSPWALKNLPTHPTYDKFFFNPEEGSSPITKPKSQRIAVPISPVLCVLLPTAWLSRFPKHFSFPVLNYLPTPPPGRLCIKINSIRVLNWIGHVFIVVPTFHLDKHTLIKWLHNFEASLYHVMWNLTIMSSWLPMISHWPVEHSGHQVSHLFSHLCFQCHQ